MARARNAASLIPSREAEYREIEAWYARLLADTPPPADLEWEPVKIGPTWQWENGWQLPEASLGWSFLSWCGHWLRGKGRAPWTFTPEQTRFLLWYYAVDSNGDFLYHSAMLQRLKGWGKDPIAATVAAGSLHAPIVFDYFDGDRPVGHDEPDAWTQIVAVSQEQTKNTMKLFPSLISPEAQSFYGIQIGKLNVWSDGDRRQIEAITASPAAIEGGRPKQIVRNEALALDTILPTPGGATTVGDVQCGDEILGSSGPVRVTKVTKVYSGRPCYRVVFDDGSSLVADEGHLWVAKHSGETEKIVTTEQMSKSARRWQVPLVELIDMPAADLPIAPYVLGYWLGDGDKAGATLAVGDEDIEFVRSEMEYHGLNVKLYAYGSQTKRLGLATPGARRNRNDKRPIGFYGQLSALGLLGNKRVPTAYLRSSAAQRLDLLRGLMDSDGCITSDQRAVFVNQNAELAAAVVELARSLGYKVSTATTTDDRWDSGTRTGYRVSFRVDQDQNPFLMPRKAAKVSGRSRRWKSVRAVEPVASVPVKCIQVDSDDHLFVAGDGWTLTHNTQNWDQSNGGHDMAGAIEGNAAKAEIGAPARILDIFNAFRPGRDSVAERAREAYEDTQGADGIQDYGVLLDSLEAPPQAPLTADAAPSVVQSIAGDAKWLDVRPNGRIIKSILNPANSPSESRRKWYNQVTGTEDSWVEPRWVEQTARPDDKIADGEQVVMFGDGSKSDDATGLVLVRFSDGFIQTHHMQLPGKGEIVSRQLVDEAVQIAFDRYRVVAFWFDPSHAKADDAVEDDRFWWPLCDEWHERYQRRLKLWPVQSGPRKHSIAFDMLKPMQQQMFQPAVSQLAEDLEAGTALHHGGARLKQHMKNARRREGRFGISIGKEHRSSKRKIDLAVCAVGARMLWRQMRINKKTNAPGKGRSFSI